MICHVQVRTASCGATACVNTFGDEQLAVDLLADKLLFEALKFSVSAPLTNASPAALHTIQRCSAASCSRISTPCAAGPRPAYPASRPLSCTNSGFLAPCMIIRFTMLLHRLLHVRHQMQPLQRSRNFRPLASLDCSLLLKPFAEIIVDLMPSCLAGCCQIRLL